jgi:hypothetical protein
MALGALPRPGRVPKQPRNSSVAAAELHNSFSKNTDRFRVFRPEALYRRRGGVRGSTRPPHHGAVRARGRATPW